MAVKFIDRPCGYGKTTEVINRLTPDRSWLLVVQTLDEVERYVSNAPIELHVPQRGEYENKSLHLKLLMASGQSIVCTHALFDIMDAENTDFSRYDVIIDETFEVLRQVNGPTKSEFEELYLKPSEDGEPLARLSDNMSGAQRVIPSPRWIKVGDGGLECKMLDIAVAGRLYYTDKGFFVNVAPVELFSNSLSCTVLTFIAEGSMMAAFLDKHEVAYEIDRDLEIEQEFKRKARELLTVRYLPNNLSWGVGKQDKLTTKNLVSIGGNLRRFLDRVVKPQDFPKPPYSKNFDLSMEEVLLCSMKKTRYTGKFSRRENMEMGDDSPGEVETLAPSAFAREARLTKSPWVAKNVKGTNKYGHCKLVVMAYAINQNPAVDSYLRMDGEGLDTWRVLEMVQVVWRARIRNGEKVSVIFLDKRMHDLFRAFFETQ